MADGMAHERLCRYYCVGVNNEEQHPMALTSKPSSFNEGVGDRFRHDFFEFLMVGDLNRAKKRAEIMVPRLGDFMRKIRDQIGSTKATKAINRLATRRWIQDTLLRPNDWTALHAAAAMGHFHIVEFLLQDCEVDPTARTRDGQTAAQLVYEGDDKDGKLRCLLKTLAFQKISAELLLKASETPVTETDLRQLLGHLTSVQDLRIFFTLGASSLTTREMHDVLRDAFGEVIREKLVFDDSNWRFFRRVRKASKHKGFISPDESSNWKHQATKVNMESADWVREIKWKLQQLESRVTANEANINALYKNLCALREALIQKERNEMERARRERLIRLVTGALVLVGGPALGDLIGAVTDVFEPAELLLTLTDLTAEGLEDFVTGAPMEFVFEACVRKALHDSSIEEAEFADVLRDAIKLEREERLLDDEAPDEQKLSALHSSAPNGVSLESGGGVASPATTDNASAVIAESDPTRRLARGQRQ